MPIYKQTTEITNIDDLLSSVERDIEKVYFGDKQVFTVWGEYDGTLPATYTANGSALADYRIYGAAGGVGDDSGTAYGYVLPMDVSGDVYIDKNKGLYGYTITSYNSSITKNGSWWVSDYIPVMEGATYTGIDTGSDMLLYSEIGGTATGAIGLRNGYTIPQGKHYIKMNVNIANLNIFAVSAKYPLIPVYIGDEPLGEDEHVNYGEQKVYRRTEQLFNAETAVYKNGVYKNDIGVEAYYPGAGYYETYMPITPSETIYVINAHGSTNLTVRLYFYDAQKQWISRTIGYVNDFSVVAPSNAAYAQLQISPQFIPSPNMITITQDSTAPTDYIPYLSPQDPPVPLPQLPTVNGVTVVNYAGQSTEPSRFYAKYRKQNF